jgi:putative protein-disulfide isomerase
MSIIIRYLFDPLCGWCYGAAPGVSVLAEAVDVEIELFPTGLFSGDGARSMNSEFATYAWSNDQRIHQLTGQIFSDRYKQAVLGNFQQRLDSGPATLALTAISITDSRQEFAALKAIQRARYIDGKDVTDIEVLATLLADLKLESAAAVLKQNNNELEQVNSARIVEAQKLMREFGVRGVPNFIGIKTSKDVKGVKEKLLDGRAICEKPQAVLDELRAI